MSIERRAEAKAKAKAKAKAVEEWVMMEFRVSTGARRFAAVGARARGMALNGGTSVVVWG